MISKKRKKQLKVLIIPASIFIPLIIVVVIASYFASVKLVKDPSKSKYSGVLKSQFEEFLSEHSKNSLTIDPGDINFSSGEAKVNDIKYITAFKITHNNSDMLQYGLQFSFLIDGDKKEINQDSLIFINNTESNTITSKRILYAFTTGDSYHSKSIVGLN